MSGGRGNTSKRARRSMLWRRGSRTKRRRSSACEGDHVPWRTRLPCWHSLSAIERTTKLKAVFRETWLPKAQARVSQVGKVRRIDEANTTAIGLPWPALAELNIFSLLERDARQCAAFRPFAAAKVIKAHAIPNFLQHSLSFVPRCTNEFFMRDATGGGTHRAG